MFSVSGTRVLAIGAHADDLVLGCGAALARFVREGAVIQSVILSLRMKATPSKYTTDDVMKEVIESHKILGITAPIIKSYPNRVFPDYRQGILEDFHSFKTTFSPDLVIAHSMADYHQDHQVVAAECFRIFKDRTILGFNLVHNTLTTNKQLFVSVTKEDVEKKLAAIVAYRSQKNIRPRLFSSDTAMCLLQANGVQVGLQYAEVFDCIRLVMGGK